MPRSSPAPHKRRSRFSHSVPNKHQLKTEATRRKLLKSALRIFARDGFEAARIEDIAAEAGYTRGAFYAQFQAKEDLFLALLEQQASQRIRELQTLLEACSSPEQRLEALRAYYVNRAVDREWVMLNLEFKLFAVRHPKLRARLAAAHRAIRDSVKVGIRKFLREEIQYGAESEEAVRAALEAMLSGLVLEHAYDPKRMSDDHVISVLRSVFDLLIHPPA